MSTDILNSFYAAARELEPSEQLVAHVIDQASPPARSRTGKSRRRRLIVALAGAVTLALAASALAASLGVIHLSDPAHQLIDANAARTNGLPSALGAPESTQIYCDAPGREVEAAATGEDPVQICAALWRKGIVNGTKQEPPALQACVAPNGTIAVHPGANACATIGRPVAEPYTADDLQAIKLANALRAWIDSTPRGCVTVNEGVAKITDVLSQMNLDDAGWRIAIDDRSSHRSDDGKQCAIPTAFAAKKTVLLG